MLLAKGDELWDARHGAVVIAHLAQHASWLQAREPTQVDRCLGVPVALQYAASTRSQREDVTGPVEVGWLAVRVRKGRKVAARSAAEIPVDVEVDLASTETVKAVPLGSSLFTHIGGSCKAWRRSSGTETQMTPELWRTIKPTVSSVASSPAMIRSPSFSLSSSSVTTIGLPSFNALIAAMTEFRPNGVT